MVKLSKKLRAIQKRRKERYVRIISFLIIISVIIVGVMFSYKFVYNSSPQTIKSTRLKAIIIDALSTSYPNNDLIEYMKKALEEKGFSVDILSGENVTVDNLQFKIFSIINDYQIIIFRVHGGIIKNPKNYVGKVGIFTAEPYKPGKHTDLLYMGFLGIGIPFAEKDKKYFVITPLYVLSSNTKFQRSIVYVSSCYSLSAPDMAEAFIDKGAKTYIGWTGLVDIYKADQALKLFIKEFIEENKTLCEAIKDINNKTSTNTSSLKIYPENTCEYSINDFINKIWRQTKT